MGIIRVVWCDVGVFDSSLIVGVIRVFDVT